MLQNIDLYLQRKPHGIVCSKIRIYTEELLSSLTYSKPVISNQFPSWKIQLNYYKLLLATNYVT